jgi:hypothetical protein
LKLIKSSMSCPHTAKQFSVFKKTQKMFQQEAILDTKYNNVLKNYRAYYFTIK